MSVNYNIYISQSMKGQFGPNWSRNPGCQYLSLFNISPEKIVIDELHLVLRITERLELGLILEVLDWDEVCDFYS